MMVKLNQAVGRLIRDISDYGIVSILDERLYTNKEYGSIIYDSFEKLGYIITRNHDEVSTFIKRGKENVKDISYAKYSRDKLTMHKALSKKMLARKTTNYDILGYNVGMNKNLKKSI